MCVLSTGGVGGWSDQVQDNCQRDSRGVEGGKVGGVCA